MSRYVVAYQSEDGQMKVSHLDGVPWWQAPEPRWFHRHWPQTDGWERYFDQTQRCACGAIRVNRGSQRWYRERRRRP